MLSHEARSVKVLNVKEVKARFNRIVSELPTNRKSNVQREEMHSRIMPTFPVAPLGP